MGAGTNKGMKAECKWEVYFEQEIQPNIYCDNQTACHRALQSSIIIISSYLSWWSWLIEKESSTIFVLRQFAGPKRIIAERV